MTRIIETVGNPDPGHVILAHDMAVGVLPNSVIADYPDLRRPPLGQGYVKVQLSTDTPCLTKAKLEIIQDQSQIDDFSDKVLGGPIEYVITYTPEEYAVQFGSAVMGRCHLSKLKVRVTATIPDQLTGSFGAIDGHCDCSGSGGDGSTTLNYDAGSGAWVSDPAEFCGVSYTAEVKFVDGVLQCWMTGGCIGGDSVTEPTLAQVWTFSCDPFEAKFLWLDSLIGNPEFPDQSCCTPADDPPELETLTFTVTL
jgi:hypothetical protein